MSLNCFAINFQNDQSTDQFNENQFQNQQTDKIQNNYSKADLNLFKVEDHPNISIKISGNSEEIKCSLDPKVKTYICPHNGQNILAKNSHFGFSLLRVNKDNIPEVTYATNITSGDETILSTPAYSFGSDVGTPFRARDISSEFMAKVMAIDSFFGHDAKGLNASEEPSIVGSELYEQIAGNFFKQKEKFLEEMQQVFSQKKYQIELADGQKINCQRGGTRDLSQEEIDFQTTSGAKIQCGSFKCDKVRVGGKEYEATLLYESVLGSLSTPSLHLIDQKNSMGPSVSIRKLNSDKSNLPLVDNSSFIDNESGYSNYASYLMTAAIPVSLPNRDKIAFYKMPGFNQYLNYLKNICNSEANGLPELINVRTKLLENLANLEMIELIQVLSNGSLIGNYIDPSRAGDYGCFYNGLILDPEAVKHFDKIKKNIRPDERVDQTISLNRATELFNKAAAMKDISWNYKPDGCYARAHLMARRFEEEGVRVDKVWIKGDLSVPGSKPPINWNFHVAPIVYIDDGRGGVKKMVIDPSLFDKPVSVEEWDNRMTKNTIRGSVVTAFPFPENAAMMERSALSFSSSDPYLPRDSIHLSESEKLKMSRSTMDMYLKAGKQ